MAAKFPSDRDDHTLADLDFLGSYLASCAHQASLDSVEQPMRLGPLDQITLCWMPIDVLYVYPASQASSSSELISIDRLWKAMELLLDFYPHLTGRIRIDLRTGSPEIVKLGSGAELQSWSCSRRLDEYRSSPSARLLVSDLPDRGYALIVPCETDAAKVSERPFFVVKHTRFACGSVALGIRLPHLLGDAEGFFMMVGHLAELYRNLHSNGHTPMLASPPDLGFYLHHMNDASQEERQAALQYEPWMFASSTEPDKPLEIGIGLQASSSKPPITGRILHFPVADLAALKAEATSKELNPDGFVSTYEALISHLWKHIFIARLKHARATSAPESEISTFIWVPINLRRPDRLNFGARYFANATAGNFFSLPRETLEAAPLAQIATAVHEKIRDFSYTDVAATLKWIGAHEDKTVIRMQVRFDSGIYMCTQWAKFPVYVGVDYDGVDPELVCPPFTPITMTDGVSFILPTKDQQNDPSNLAAPQSIDVPLFLPQPVWELLEEDEAFRKYGQLFRPRIPSKE